METVETIFDYDDECQFSGEKYKTIFSVTQEVFEFLCKEKRKDVYGDPYYMPLKKYSEYAVGGFRNYPKIIKHEWDQVYRIETKDGNYRIFGFFHHNSDEFIAIRAIKKKGQKLTTKEQKIVDQVAAIKNAGEDDPDGWQYGELE